MRTIESITDLIAERDRLKAEVARLQAGHLESEKQLRATRDEIGVLLEDVNRLQKERDKWEQRCADLAAQIMDTELEIAKLRAAIGARKERF